MNFARPDYVDPSVILAESVEMAALLDNALLIDREEKAANRYNDRPKSLGAGRVGHPCASAPYERGCERALYYEMRMYKTEKPFPPFLYRIFEMGHQGEDIVVENLRLAGFTVLTHDEKTGNQFGFAIAHDPETGFPRYKGFCDGVIVAGPESMGGVVLKYPMLWENKMLNNKGFDSFVSKGLEKAYPKYYAQTLQYQNFLNLFQNPALLTCGNRNTGHIASEFIRFNQKHCQAIIDRASRVIEAKGPLALERGASEYEKLPCKWCEYREQCRKDEEHRPQAPSNEQQTAPSWLSQGSQG